MGNLTQAIEYYHQALGLRPHDDFASSMLAVAVGEQADARTAELTRGMEPLALS